MMPQFVASYQRRYFELRPGSFAWFLPSQVNEEGVVTGAPRGAIPTSSLTVEHVAPLVHQHSSSSIGSLIGSATTPASAAPLKRSGSPQADSPSGSATDTMQPVAAATEARFAVSWKEGSSTRRIELAGDSRHDVEFWVEALRGMAGKHHNSCSLTPMVNRARKRDTIHAAAKTSVSSVSGILTKAQGRVQQRRGSMGCDDDDEDHACFVSLKCGDDEYSRALLFSVESEQEGQVFVEVVQRMSRDKKSMVEKEAREQMTFENRLRVAAYDAYFSTPGQVVSNIMILMAFTVTLVDSQLKTSADNPIGRSIQWLEVAFAVGPVSVLAYVRQYFCLLASSLPRLTCNMTAPRPPDPLWCRAHHSVYRLRPQGFFQTRLVFVVFLSITRAILSKLLLSRNIWD